MRLATTIIVATVLALGGCGFTREVKVLQGKAGITPSAVVGTNGLARQEVRDLLGPPQVLWELDGEVWLYHFRQDDEAGIEEFSAELRFDADGEVTQVSITGRQD